MALRKERRDNVVVYLYDKGHHSNGVRTCFPPKLMFVFPLGVHVNPIIPMASPHLRFGVLDSRRRPRLVGDDLDSYRRLLDRSQWSHDAFNVSESFNPLSEKRKKKRKKKRRKPQGTPWDQVIWPR